MTRLLEDHSNLIMISAPSKLLLTTLKGFEKYGLFFDWTECIDFIEYGTFATRFYPAPTPIFLFIRAFDFYAWLLIILMIFILALFTSVESGESRKFFNYLWNYFELIFSKSIQNLLIKNKSKIILGTSLIASFFISLGFTVNLLDYMIKAEPILKLNTVEELSLREEMTVFTRSDTGFNTWAQITDSDVAMRIRKMLRWWDDIKAVHDELLTGLRNGSTAFSSNRLNLIFELSAFSEEEIIEQGEKRLIDLMHISKEGLGFDPYFMVMKQDVESWVFDAVNQM